MKRTKGMWYHRRVENKTLISTDASSRNICKILNWDEEAEANAKLIAAAPELLEALQELLIEVKSLELSHGQKVNDWLEEEISKAELAIKKATT